MDKAAEILTDWAHLALLWVGFGTVVGFLAKLLIPGKDPGGTLATVVIGIFGTVTGAALFFFFSGVKITPISIAGFAVALAATVLLLVIYRILYGQKWTTGITYLKWHRPTRRRTAATAVLEE